MLRRRDAVDPLQPYGSLIAEPVSPPEGAGVVAGQRIPGLDRWPQFGAAAIILATVALRLSMLHLSWPELNSDEATMGLMARHIAYGGALPIYFYGQSYMGALEAYLGAVSFHLFGPTAMSLRLGLVLMFAVFMVVMYALASRLYGHRVALISLAVLALGSKEILLRQLTAVGGAMETLLFGSLLLLLATQLALSTVEGRNPTRRLLVYSAWGLAAGLGFWSHMLILPFIAASALLIILTCGPELRRRGVLALLLAGLLVGLGPVIAYDATHTPDKSAIAVLYYTFRNKASGQHANHTTLAQQVAGTMLVSVPLATGMSPLCGLSPQASWPLSGSSGAHTFLCAAMRGAWSTALVGLWFLALFADVRRLRRRRDRAGPPEPLRWRVRPWPKGQPTNAGQSRDRVLALARLAVVAAVGLTVGLYMLGPAAALDPRSTSRYLVAVAIGVPPILSMILRPLGRRVRFPRRVGGIAAIAGLLGVLLVGTHAVLGSEADYTRWKSGQEAALIDGLIHMHATRVYTDYWTCDRLAFQSQERIICAVLGNHLEPGQDRYTPYRAAVRADPTAAYVFPVGSPQARLLSTLAGPHSPYQKTELNGYVLYRLTRSS